MKDCPLKISLSMKEKLQLDSDLYIYGEGTGMCQDGAIELFQYRSGVMSTIRFHRNDLSKIILALKESSNIPLFTSKNEVEFNKALRALDEKFERD